MPVSITCADSTLVDPAALAALADCVITDPPYSEKVHSSAISHSRAGGVRSRKLGFDSLDKRSRDWLLSVCQHTRGWSVLFSDVECAHMLMAHRKPHRYIRAVPWVRWSAPQLSADRPPSGCELIVLGHGKGRPKYNGPGGLVSFDDKCLRGSNKHPAEKPLDLCMRLVSYFSSPGDTVLDPFAGSGTIALACQLLDRHCIAIEQSSHWVNSARVRLANPLSKRDSARLTRFKSL
jgi:site-specific DNA-methyltransferase (adenine-specific)